MRATILVGTALLLIAACGADDPAPAPQGGEPEATPVAAASDPPAAGSAGEPRDTVPSTGPSAAGGDWTAGITHVERTNVGVATAVATRVARHEGFERFVLELAAGDTLPGYHIEYIDRPVRQCGSGHAVELVGDGWLSIRLEPARAHTDDGRPMLRERRLLPRQPVIREAVLTCDFEAHLEWVLGVSSPNRYRVIELSEPARLVVDIRSD